MQSGDALLSRCIQLALVLLKGCSARESALMHCAQLQGVLGVRAGLWLGWRTWEQAKLLRLHSLRRCACHKRRSSYANQASGCRQRVHLQMKTCYVHRADA